MRSMRFVPVFILVAILAVQLIAEKSAKAAPGCGCPFEKQKSKPIVGKVMPRLRVMDSCTNAQCFYSEIPAGWHAPKDKPQKDNVRQVYYLADMNRAVKMLSVVSVELNEQEKAEMLEKLKQQCEAESVKFGWDKKRCLDNKDEPQQKIAAICVATQKDCEKFECLGQCYEPYPSSRPMRQTKK